MNALRAMHLPNGESVETLALGGGASARWLSGERLFLQHGPINLIVKAHGVPEALDAAYRRLMRAFPEFLERLVEELPRLRAAESTTLPWPDGRIAKRMVEAVRPFAPIHVTPMAAVAGAVADEALQQLTSAPGIDRAYVNNGGDIAVHLGPGQAITLGIVAEVEAPAVAGTLRIDESTRFRGVATSGWRGRSHSLGIADSVTVLARSAALADASATLIANAVDADHPGIRRTPAFELDEDSDLEDRMVTVEVPELPASVVDAALDRGQEEAGRLRGEALIEAAALCVQGRWRVVHWPALVSVQ